MAIGIEWIKNKDEQRIYPVTHAKATVRGNGTLDDSLTALEQNVKDLEAEIDKLDIDTLNGHIDEKINSEKGVHGFRYYNEELQFWNGYTWVVIETSGTSGVAPADMKSVAVALGDDATQLILTGTDPDDIVVDGITISKWSGTKIVRKVGGYPTRPSDGVLVAHYQTRNQYAENGFVDKGLVPGEIYYYKWFPYSDMGVINNTDDLGANRANGVPTGSDVLGVIVDWENVAFTRTDDAADIDAGEQFDKYTMYGLRRRCMVADDGAILAFYGQDGYTEDGKISVDMRVNKVLYPAGTSVQVMVYQPKFYYKVVPLTTIDNPNGTGTLIRSAKYQVAERQLPGFSVHPAFIREGQEVPYILLSAYEACTQDAGGRYVRDNVTQGNRLASIPEAAPATSSAATLSRRVARDMARRRGIGWGLHDISALSCTQLLFLIEYMTMNSQTAIGKGVVDGTSAANILNTGGTIDLGNRTGVGEGLAGKASVTYRGEENLWGNVSTWVDGINLHNNNSGVAYFCLNQLDHQDDKLDDSYSSSGYNFVRDSGYVSAYGYSTDCDWMFIPAEVSGDSTKPVGDYLYENFTQSDVSVAYFGGCYKDSYKAGMFNFDLSCLPTYGNDSIGARIMYAPITVE